MKPTLSPAEKAEAIAKVLDVFAPSTEPPNIRVLGESGVLRDAMTTLLCSAEMIQGGKRIRGSCAPDLPNQILTALGGSEAIVEQIKATCPDLTADEITQRAERAREAIETQEQHIVTYFLALTKKFTFGLRDICKATGAKDVYRNSIRVEDGKEGTPQHTHFTAMGCGSFVDADVTGDATMKKRFEDILSQPHLITPNVIDGYVQGIYCERQKPNMRQYGMIFEKILQERITASQITDGTSFFLVQAQIQAVENGHPYTEWIRWKGKNLPETVIQWLQTKMMLEGTPQSGKSFIAQILVERGMLTPQEILTQQLLSCFSLEGVQRLINTLLHRTPEDLESQHAIEEIIAHLALMQGVLVGRMYGEQHSARDLARGHIWEIIQRTERGEWSLRPGPRGFFSSLVSGEDTPGSTSQLWILAKTLQQKRENEMAPALKRAWEGQEKRRVYEEAKADIRKRFSSPPPNALEALPLVTSSAKESMQAEYALVQGEEQRTYQRFPLFTEFVQTAQKKGYLGDDAAIIQVADTALAEVKKHCDTLKKPEEYGDVQKPGDEFRLHHTNTVISAFLRIQDLPASALGMLMKKLLQSPQVRDRHTPKTTDPISCIRDRIVSDHLSQLAERLLPEDYNALVSSLNQNMDHKYVRYLCTGPLNEQNLLNILRICAETLEKPVSHRQDLFHVLELFGIYKAGRWELESNLPSALFKKTTSFRNSPEVIEAFKRLVNWGNSLGSLHFRQEEAPWRREHFLFILRQLEAELCSWEEIDAGAQARKEAALSTDQGERAYAAWFLEAERNLAL